MDKTELRKNAKKRIRELTGKTGESERIMENLKALREYNDAETILAFFPLSDEPDIIPLIKSDPRVLFPYIDKGTMHFGPAHTLPSGGSSSTPNGRRGCRYGGWRRLSSLAAYVCWI